MRVKRGVTIRHKHNKIRKATKGMTRARRSSIKMGKQGVVKALQYAYRDRRNRKRTMRQLWNARISAAAKDNGTSYSKLMNGLTKAGITLNRKMLAEIAATEPKAFTAVVKAAK